MAFEFKITRPVEFADTDMAGIVYFANFFRYMEVCETAFFRSLGLALIDGAGALRTGWPRVHASCDYLDPLRFGDTVEVHLLVKELKPRALSYVFLFNKLTPGGGPVAVARGELTVVYAALDDTTRRMTARGLPPEVLAKIEVAPPAAWAS